jgi:uncharacterized protein (TIGR02284 family)
MANLNEKVVDMLNELVRINNDRIEGYMRAAKETDDSDLRLLFSDMAQQSQKYRDDLANLVSGMGGEVADGTTISGKFYRVWMDVKALLSSNDRKTALENCEFGEDVALESYETALESGVDYDNNVRSTLREHKEGIQRSHDKIRTMRDAAKRNA